MIVPFAGKHRLSRGDDHFIRIGAETNVQDNVVIHEGQGDHPAVFGDRDMCATGRD